MDNIRKACTNCRSRKLRCDGKYPACGRCAKRYLTPSQPCEYVSVNSLPKTPSIRRGSACLPCRRRKKRCDAQRPCCRVCALTDRADQCKYEAISSKASQSAPIDQRENGALQIVRTSASSRGDPVLHLSSSSPSSNSHYAMVFEAFNNPSLQMDPVLLDSSLATNFPPLIYEYFPAQSPERTFLTLPTSSRGLEIRDCFLHHRGQMCLSLTSPKARALRHGDLSGALIHPAFVPIATLIGFIYWQDNHGHFDCGREDDLLEAAKASLMLLRAESTSHDRLLLLMQAYALMAWYFFWRSRVTLGYDSLRRAVEILRRLDLPALLLATVKGTADGGRVPGDISTDAWNDEEERVAAFSQLLFLDCVAQTLKAAKPWLSKEHIAIFFTLKTIAPAAWEGNLSIISARGAVLLSHVLRLCRLWVNARPMLGDDGDRDMISEYWKLMKDASDLTATMKVAALRATFSANDTYYRVSLKCTLIKSLTAQAMLHWLQHDHHDSRRLAAESVCEIISITEMLTDDEYPLMDVVVSVCWIYAAGIFFRDHTALHQKPATAAMNLSVLSHAFDRLEISLPYVSDARKFPPDFELFL